MKYILQVYNGSWRVLSEDPAAVIRKIDGIASRIPVSKVIIGWNTEKSVYKEIGALLRNRDIEMLISLSPCCTGEQMLRLVSDMNTDSLKNKRRLLGERLKLQWTSLFWIRSLMKSAVFHVKSIPA